MFAPTGFWFHANSPLWAPQRLPICPYLSHTHDWCQSSRTNCALSIWTFSQPAGMVTDRCGPWMLLNLSASPSLLFPRFSDLPVTCRWLVRGAVWRRFISINELFIQLKDRFDVQFYHYFTTIGSNKPSYSSIQRNHSQNWLSWCIRRLHWRKSDSESTEISKTRPTNCTFFEIFGLEMASTPLAAKPIESRSPSAGVTSCSVADFLNMTSNADRILNGTNESINQYAIFHASKTTHRLSVPVIVEYGVIAGLVDDNGVNPFNVNELVFFRIDFRGSVPNAGLLMVSLVFLACGGNISLLASSRNFRMSGAGMTSNRDGRRVLLRSSTSRCKRSCSSRARSCASFCHLAATSSRFSRPICLSIILMSSWRCTEPKRIMFCGVSTTGKLRRCLFFYRGRKEGGLAQWYQYGYSESFGYLEDLSQLLIADIRPNIFDIANHEMLHENCVHPWREE